MIKEPESKNDGVIELSYKIGQAVRNRIKQAGGRKEFMERSEVTDSILTRFFNGENVSVRSVYQIFEDAGLGHVLKYLSECDRVKSSDDDPLLISFENLLSFAVLNGRENEIRTIVEKICRKN